MDSDIWMAFRPQKGFLVEPSFDLGFLVEPSFKLRFITLREAVTDCTNKQANKHGRGRETHENDR